MSEAELTRFLLERCNFNSKFFESKGDAKLRRLKDAWLFFATLVCLAISFVTCIIILFCQGSSSAHFNAAFQAIIGLTMGLAGYYTRGETLKKPH